MISRRWLTRGGLAWASAAPAWGQAPDAPAIPASGQLAFDVIRLGGVIGTCTLRFDPQGSDLTVRSTLSITVGFGPVALYRYSQRDMERWSDGRFAGLDSETNNNGKIMRVVARRRDQGIAIETNGQPRGLAPPDALPLTHWNHQNMTAPLFSPEDGRMMHDTVTARGEETVRLADGKPVRAERFSLTGGAMTTDDWYDPARIWTAMRVVVSDGSVIDYRRTV